MAASSLGRQSLLIAGAEHLFRTERIKSFGGAGIPACADQRRFLSFLLRHFGAGAFRLVAGGGAVTLGGTMRLGAWPCKLEKDSWAHKAFGELEISERHRHRYEFNREYEETLEAHGLRLTGATPDGTYVEIVEVGDHPWFLGCQFHPEFKSKPFAPHPLFKAFIQAAYRNRTAARDQAESPRPEVAQKEA